MPGLLLLDNHDSFTWNLAHALELLGSAPEVRLSDRVGVAELLAADYSAIVLSPGPGRPEEAGVSVELVRAAAGRVPLLGVCLGHQAIAHALGGRVVRAARLVHGKTSPIFHDGAGLFRDLPSPFAATRYHSLAVEERGLPDELRVTARADDGVVMALAHVRLPLWGVQFHPESVLSLEGPRLLGTFLALARAWHAGAGPAGLPGAGKGG